MNRQPRYLHYLLVALLFLTIIVSPVIAQHDFRTLTPVEAAYFKKVNEIMRKTLPAHIGTLKLIQVDEAETSTTEKVMLSTHPPNKGPYVVGYFFEYGKTVDDIRTASKLSDAINKAVNEGNETKEREMNDQLSKLAAEQRCRIDVMVNFDLLNFNYIKDKVVPLPVKDAVAYRTAFTEDVGDGLTYLMGTYIGVGEFKAPKDQPYDGNEGGVFEVETKKPAGQELVIENVVFRIYTAPAIADQLIKQMDIVGLKEVLGKKLIP